VLDLTPSRNSIKKAAEKSTLRRKSVLGWPTVLRALQDDEGRLDVMSRYRAAGFTPDDFANVRAARETMADALTRTEDRVELLRAASRRDEQRRAVRDVRRRLERELWP
jgi:hypothetical protein